MNNNNLFSSKSVNFIIKENNKSNIESILTKSKLLEKENFFTLNNLPNSAPNPNNFKRNIINPPNNILIQPIENSGIKKIVSLIVTHNSRMQCLLKELLKIDGKYQKIRFQNCAILRLELQKDKPLLIDLVYEGELTDFEIKFGQLSNNTKNGLLSDSTSDATSNATNLENSSNTGRNTLYNNNFKNIKQIAKKRKNFILIMLILILKY